MSRKNARVLCHCVQVAVDASKTRQESVFDSRFTWDRGASVFFTSDKPHRNAWTLNEIAFSFSHPPSKYNEETVAYSAKLLFLLQLNCIIRWGLKRAEPWWLCKLRQRWIADQLLEFTQVNCKSAHGIYPGELQTNSGNLLRCWCFRKIVPGCLG